MRRSGDELTVGERIAFYRGRRSLTQVELAGLVGRSEDWLSKIERGERPIRRVDALTELARVLRVTLPDLLGGAGNVPVVVFPRVNAAHARQPAWSGHLAALRSAGVRLIYGEDVWPLHEPRSAAPDRDMPWGHILTLATDAISS